MPRKEKGDETFASPLADASVEFEFDPSTANCGARATKSHDANEIDALHAVKRDVEEKLDAMGHQNRFLSLESTRLEVLMSQAHDEVATTESVAAANEVEVARLRTEVKHLQDLLDTENSISRAEKQAIERVLGEAHPRGVDRGHEGFRRHHRRREGQGGGGETVWQARKWRRGMGDARRRVTRRPPH
jgi:hypothetical protein